MKWTKVKNEKKTKNANNFDIVLWFFNPSVENVLLSKLHPFFFFLFANFEI